MDLREHRYKKFFAIPNVFLGILICMVLSLLVPWVSSLQAQDLQQVKGDFSLKNYSPDEYGAHHQNWFVAQDRLGFIYAGNTDGILEYDGVSWRLITWPGLRAVRCVTVDEDNIKWIGADRELGYLEPDSLGFLKYRSLKEKIPKSHPLTGNIWKVFTTRDEVLFVTDDTIYLWKGDKFTIVPSTGELNKEFQVNDTIYFRIKERGLFRLWGDSLRLAPNGALFKELRADVLFPYKGDSLLFVSRDNGVFVYGNSGVTKMSSQVDEYLKENTLYTGLMLPDSTYALATLRAGVVIMDKNGKFLKKITVADGMPTDQIHELALDVDKGLWLAHQMGISRLEPFLPYTKFGKESGVEGTVWTIALHGGSIYAATSAGLYILESGVGSSVPKFRRVQGIERACLSILSVEQGLLAATADGTFLVSEHGITLVEASLGARTLYRSQIDPSRIYIGHFRGLASLYLENGKWQDEKNRYGLDDHIVDISETDDGSIWLRAALQYIIRVNLPTVRGQGKELELDNMATKYYGQEQGFPDGFTHMFVIDGAFYANANRDDGPLFKFDFKTEKFSSAPQFGQRFGLDSLSVYPLVSQGNGEHLLLESVRQGGNSYRFSARINPLNGRYSARRIYDERSRSVSEISAFWDDNHQLWLGGEWITKYDLDKPFGPKSNFSTYIRKVIAGQDSIIFAGNGPDSLKHQLDHSIGQLRFEYAAPGFSDPEGKRYQYLLAGFDEAWSDWTGEARKDYTNLPEGRYQFVARAQNIYGDISTVGTFNFEIFPPWYRTWWAYLLYLLLFIGFLWILFRWRSHQLKAKNEALEKLVAVRTSEVQHQANQLMIQAEKLQELDKAKSRFFANISHEFRTPLTLIKGPIEQLEQNFTEKMSRETVKMIRRNANRLLNMVNQLLDLSKIDEGSLKLSPTEGDVHKCIRAAASSFNSHAAQRNMDYRVQIPQTVLWASFDRDKLENIVYNLLGNAFKFSGDGSEIAFISQFNEFGLQIQVSDSGKGIPKEKLPFIFDRFYRADDTNIRKTGGSGIGLSLSKDLVELMDGTITVSSEVGKGSFFSLQLPIQEIMTPAKKEKRVEIFDDFKFRIQPFELTNTDKRTVPNILLIEDNSDMRHFIKEQLIKFYKVKEAINGKTGLKKAIADPPDLIITDLMMPKMDGVELCKKLKTEVHTSHIPVIMLTAKAGMENKIEGLEIGADDYLTKPFDGKELLVRIKNLIEQRRKLRELFSNREVHVNPQNITVTSIDQKFLERLLRLLEAHFSNPDFGVSQMQEAMAMSKTQLHRKLKGLTNEAPGELLRNFRLKRAAQLLSQKADSITQIAYKVGFNNLSYFAKCFKELYGVAPSSY